MYRFAPASETEQTVFGAARPGYSNLKVFEWIEFMQSHGVNRVCCLLTQSQLSKYSDLLGIYQQKFGKEKVCWIPIKDFHFIDRNTLIEKILPFLIATEQQEQRVVVHCSEGIGRTGQVLSAWLVAKRGLSNKEAISAVKSTGRNPHEAVLATTILTGKNPGKIIQSFDILLNNCRNI